MGLISASLSTKDMARLCHTLATLYDGGVPLVRAFKVLEESGGSRDLRNIARELRQAIEQGATLAQAAEFHRRRLSPVFVKMISVAEQTGGLAVVLPQLTKYYEDLRAMYNAVIRQVAYPASVLVAIFVGIPILQAFLSDVAGISKEPFEVQLFWILSNFGLTMGGALLAVVLIARLTLSLTTRESILMHCWPFAGIVRTILLSRFTWAMMVFTRAGLPLHHAVRMSGEVTGAKRIAADFEKLAPLLQAGFTLEEALTQSKFFPKKNLVYISTGEHTGKLDVAFERLSGALYDSAVFKLRILIGLIEPLAVLLLGGLVMMALTP